MSIRSVFLSVTAFLAASGASRKALFERGALFILLPLMVPVFFALVQKLGLGLLFPATPAATYESASRTSWVVFDWLMISYSVLGISCECLGLSFFAKLEKKVDAVQALAFLLGAFSVLFVVLLLFYPLFPAVLDLLEPGMRPPFVD